MLALLWGGPLHPYRMQRLLKEWGKDKVIYVGQRSSLYKTIKRLQSAGLIAVRHTERDQQYPERTVYELTEPGRRSVLAWLGELVSTPRKEYPSFPAALSFLMLLGPPGALAALRQRAEALRATVRAMDAELEQHAMSLPRVSQVELEYQRAMTAAELDWVDGISDDLNLGALDWSETDFASAADAYRLDEPPGATDR